TSMDHYKGTTWYLAPEILDLKYRRSRTAYNCAVDVWAMGLSLYQFISRKDDWVGQEKVIDGQGNIRDYRLTRLEAVIQSLQQSKLKETADVIQRMLEIEVRHRITARDAWESVPAEEKEMIEFAGSKRSRIT
ncbi:MAG: hypothetical protein Q9187_003102, partial [Circinaria calcarea]